MKRKISVLLLIVYSLVNFHFIEIMKLPQLVEHFKTHKQENPKITLAKFLEMHYLHGNVKDQDYDEDMKLPLKSIASCSALSVQMFQAPFDFSFQKHQEFLLLDFPNYFIINKKEKEFSYSIWQPPKLC